MSHHGATGDISWQDMECKDGGWGGRVLAKKFSHWLGLFDLTVTNNILTNPHMVKALLVVWSEKIGEGEVFAKVFSDWLGLFNLYY